jgi:hypothetical protein
MYIFPTIWSTPALTQFERARPPVGPTDAFSFVPKQIIYDFPPASAPCGTMEKSCEHLVGKFSLLLQLMKLILRRSCRCVAMGCESASPNLASLRGFGKFRGRPLAARVGWIINTEQRIRPLWRGARWAQVPPAAPKLCENCTQPPSRTN